MQDVAPEEAKILQQRAVFAVPLRKKDDGLPCEWHVDASNQRNSSNSGGVVFASSKAKLTKVNFAEGSWLRVVAFAGAFGSAALLSAGKPKLAATIPNKRCGQK